MSEIKAIFNSRYAGSVGYYAAMLHYGSVAIDNTLCFNKKDKTLNRMDIVGTNGVQSLTIPLVKPHASMTIDRVQIAEHANWRHNHWGALFSAYGRTPFFEYFADDLRNIYFNTDITTIAAFNAALDAAIIDFLDLPIEILLLERSEGKVDLTKEKEAFQTNPAYYQIWATKHGFQPGMSILDLLFNEGREAIFTLLKR